MAATSDRERVVIALPLPEVTAPRKHKAVPLSPANRRIKRAIAYEQFSLARERFDRFEKLAHRINRKRNGLDRDRLRAALLDRLDHWWKRR